jgi:hypothetical protein
MAELVKRPKSVNYQPLISPEWVIVTSGFLH